LDDLVIILLQRNKKMQKTSAYRTLAEKFMFTSVIKHKFIPDSLLKMLAHAYTEEEAEIVNALGMLPKTAKAVAAKLHRPVNEVEPVLKSMSDRVLIGSSTSDKGVTKYTFLVLVGGVYEYQMIRSRDSDDEYYKEFARLFEDFYNEFCEFIKPRLEKRDLRFMRIVPIERSIEKTPGISVLAYDTDYYSEIIDRNKKFSLVNVCACRQQADLIGEWCGKPKDVCSQMGVMADLAVEKGLARMVSKEEFLDAKARAWDAGLINMVDNLHDPTQICSCCTCCCEVLRVLKKHNIPTFLVRSHFEAAVNKTDCDGCGACVEICSMDAITLGEDNKAHVDYAKCIGCGHCVSKCENGAMVLREREGYKKPAETAVDYAISRYFEIKGFDHNRYLPKLSLGLGRLLSKIGPHKVSGPRYKYKW
jgi:electron transport complex protein RnfB